MLPGLQALRIARLNAAAGAGTLLIDSARHALAELPLQHHTPHGLGLRAAHAAMQTANGLGQVHRHRATGRIVRLSPVKGHAKDGAARATLLTVEFRVHLPCLLTSLFITIPIALQVRAHILIPSAGNQEIS